MFKSTKEVLTALQQIRSLLMGLNERVEQSNRILSELVVALTPKAQEWTELPDYPKNPTIKMVQLYTADELPGNSRLSEIKE